MLHNVQTNGATRPSIAEQRAADYRAATLPSAPTLSRRRENLRAWLLAGACALAGAGAALGLAYQTMPIKATAIERTFADIDGDGQPDFIVSGWVIFAPKAPASQTAGQP
jgi:hypothetical protein